MGERTRLIFAREIEKEEEEGGFTCTGRGGAKDNKTGNRPAGWGEEIQQRFFYFVTFTFYSGFVKSYSSC